MAKEDLLPYQQNLDYRREFKRLGLDLEALMEFTPLDLDLENRRLKNLLDFVMAELTLKVKNAGRQKLWKVSAAARCLS